MSGMQHCQSPVLAAKELAKVLDHTSLVLYLPSEPPRISDPAWDSRLVVVDIPDVVHSVASWIRSWQITSIIPKRYFWHSNTSLIMTAANYPRFFLIYLFTRDTQREAEGEAGSLPGAPCGTWSQDPGITSRAEVKCSTTEPPRCPPPWDSYFLIFWQEALQIM